MAAPIFFGNSRKFVPIPAPFTDAAANHVGFGSNMQLANGGMRVLESADSHREYNFEWADNPKDLRIIQEFHQGVHGPGPFYMTDIFARSSNLFRDNWAMPALIEQGKQNISTVKPSFAASGTSLYNLPYREARFDLAGVTAITPRYTFVIMIPEGHQLHFGYTGWRTGNAAVMVRGIQAGGNRVTIGTQAPISVVTSNRYSTIISGSTYIGAEFSLTGVSGSPSMLAIIGMNAVLTRIGATPTLSTNWAPGEGVGGLRFSGGLRDIYGTAGGYGVPARRSLGATLVETEQWEW